MNAWLQLRRIFQIAGTTGVLLLGPVVEAATEPELIARLNSSASVTAKADACRELRVIGTHSAVPALSKLLGEDSLAHAARYALEGIEGPESLTAIRQAAAATSGRNRAGCIYSLGVRRDQEAVPLLVPLLRAADPETAAAAAAALGRVASPEAVLALETGFQQAPPETRTMLGEALLEGAETLARTGAKTAAERIYKMLQRPSTPETIRLAAWRGEILCNPDQNSRLLAQALTNAGPTFEMALLLVREIGSHPLLAACEKHWNSLPSKAQVALAEVAGNNKASGFLRLAINSASPEVRISGWRALAVANDTIHIPLLAQAAASNAPEERIAAREALARLRGSEAAQKLLAALQTSSAPARNELIRALGERRQKDAAPALLEYATGGDASAQPIALDALRKIAEPGTLQPLLRMAIETGSDLKAAAAMRAAAAALKEHADKDAAGRMVLVHVSKLSGLQKARSLTILSDLGTTEALNEALKAAHDPDDLVAKEAVKVLWQWPTGEAAGPLLDIASQSSDTGLQIQALRAALENASLISDQNRRFELLNRAFSVARDPAQKKLVLSRLGEVDSVDAWKLALNSVTEPELATESALAALNIAEKHPELAAETVEKVLAQTQAPAVVERAWKLRGVPAGDVRFVRHWLVTGPFRQSGATGAAGVFPLVFAPEKGESVTWQPLAESDTANLAEIFPGQQDCAAYLKATLFVPAPADGILLIGSDDGVKAWLNGELIHSHNVDRGQIADQDKVPVRLKPGTNELLLKITQGGGGWSACARIVGVDAKPIPGLRVEPVDTLNSSQAPPKTGP